MNELESMPTKVEHVDVVVLTRYDRPIKREVVDAIENQAGVRTLLHQHVGKARPSDQNRWETIARARNEAKSLGQNRWFMFVDDDIVLAQDCIARLVDFLRHDRKYGAVAARCLPQEHPHHVGMGTTLFRRGVLAHFNFRWKKNACECQCCCDDLRRQQIGICYVPGANAIHLRDHPPSEKDQWKQASDHVSLQLLTSLLARPGRAS